MKAARFHAPGDIRIEDVAEPVAGPGDVVIRVRNCSTCGTDVKISRHGHQNYELYAIRYAERDARRVPEQ